MKKLIYTAIFAASMALTVASNQASANVIVVIPPINAGGSTGATSSWGIQFTANDYSHLVSFDFTQKGSPFGNNNAGTITLTDITSNTTVDSWDVPHVSGAVPNILSFSGFDDSLKSGDTYQLIYTQTAGTGNNEMTAYTYYTGYYAPYTNADITVTNGIENGVSSTGIWYAFNNITTVPEPSTFAMLGLGGLVLVIRRRRTVT